MNWIKTKEYKKGQFAIYPFMSTWIDIPGVKEKDSQLAPVGTGIDISIKGEGTYHLTYTDIVQGFIKQHEYLKKQKITKDMTLGEVYRAGDLVMRAVSPKSKIVWGAKVSPELQDKAHVFVCLTGIDSAFLMQEPKHKFGPIKIY